MKHGYEHNEKGTNPGVPEDFFRRLEVPRDSSREEAWAELDKKLREAPVRKISDFRKKILIAGIAAAIILLAGVLSLMRFYTKEIICPRGEHLTCILPDGSTVELNAASEISYKPYWWRFKRDLKFSGEGYFKVEKGKKFSVISEQATTEVLGTSFNIFSRNNEYKVTCFTGKVRVASFSSAETVLTPDQSASVTATGDIILTGEASASEANSWINNMFSFRSRPLAVVLEEIARQYDVAIITKTPVDFLYTGYFSKNRPVEETLTLVCTPFGLKFARISENHYEISRN